MLRLVGSDARRSILLVEPEPRRELQTARPLFESAGFRVTCAASFDEAKRLIRDDPPDVLVTELKLGQYNGLHLVLRSRADHPGMRVIVTSHSGDSALAAEAAGQKATFLVRPVADTELLNAVNRVLHSELSAGVEREQPLI